MKPTPQDERQLRFDWSYPAARRVSRALRFPDYFTIQEAGKPRRVSREHVRMVLAVIEDHAGISGWSTVTNETLAAEAQLGLSQAKRAVKVLDEAALVIVTVNRRGQRTTRKIRPFWDGIIESELCALSDDEKDEVRSELESIIRARPRSVPETKRSVPERPRSVPETKRSVPPEGPGRCTFEVDEVSTKLRSDRSIVGMDFSLDKEEEVHRWIGEVCNHVDLQAVSSGYTRQSNWEFVAKVCALHVARKVPQFWLPQILEVIHNKVRKKPQAISIRYVIKAFRNKCSDGGFDMAAELRRVHLPVSLRFHGEEVST